MATYVTSANYKNYRIILVCVEVSFTLYCYFSWVLLFIIISFAFHVLCVDL